MSTRHCGAAARVLLMCSGLGLAPAAAWAGNGAHPRTPVDWSGAPCMTIIDRSVDPVHSFGYAVPFEDTQLTEDEVEDSRTHQFLAFCRDRYAGAWPPNWIAEADLQAAVDKGLGELGEVDLELDVLSNSPQWSGCWARITADEARRPITFAAAQEPVVWDTSELAAGTWVVDGYTHEPWLNLWTAHPGVFKIVDDPDPAASPPAAVIEVPELVELESEFSIEGCVDAMAGTTMDLAWARATINEAPVWTQFAADVEVVSGAFGYDMTTPSEAAVGPLLFRAVLEDPMGRTWTAYSRGTLSADGAGGDEEGGCEGGSFIGGGDCEEAGGSGDGGSSSTSATDSAEGGADGADGGGGGACNCTTHEGERGPPIGWGLGLALVGLAWRRLALRSRR